MLMLVWSRIMGLPSSALEFEIVATLQAIEQGLRVKVVTHCHLRLEALWAETY